MDIQSYVKNAIEAARTKRMATSDQLTLGEIILKLEPIVNKQADRIKNKLLEAEVMYDFGYMFPKKIDSWRGSYEELALDYTEQGERMSVTSFYNLLKEAVGKTFEGYKGGDFVMSTNTPVWVANYGNSSNTAVIDIIDNDYQVIIITGYREY